jgi:hypothetical protein
MGAAPQPGAVLLVEDNYALRGAPPLRGSSVDGDFGGPRGRGYGVGEWGGVVLRRGAAHLTGAAGKRKNSFVTKAQAGPKAA